MAEKDLVAKTDNSIAIFDDDLVEGETGLEEAGSDDFAIPFLRILQPQSPQVMKGADRYVESAEPGMLHNNLSNVTWPGETGLSIVPCKIQKEFIEWIPRESGGGIVDRHPDASILKQCKQDDRGQWLLGSNQIVETAQYYCLLLTDEGEEPALIPFDKTNLTVARRWNSMMRQARMQTSQGVRMAPIFAYTYALTTTIRQNDQGVWYNFVVNRSGPTEPDTIQSARDFRDVLQSGTVVPREDPLENGGSDLPDAF